jgi:arylsulfatase A-like enzyme
MKLKLLIFFILELFGLKISAQSIKPNVIIFIADDVSFDDLGCYGNKQVQTPNIDKLAAAGIRFTNCYLTASSCSPSRNSIITGRYPHNTGAAELHTQPSLEMVSFPEILINSGYYNVASGKFHMGEYARRGFDVIHEDLKQVGNGGEDMWLTSVRERPKNKPFFMWFAAYDAHRDWGENEFTGTHKPEELEPPFYLADGMKTKTDLAAYYDEIKRFDHHVGQIVAELKRQKVLDNTLIIVMADNGRPFPHSKTRVNDRGMKTPFVVHWPKRIKKSAISNSLVSAIDIAPTILEIAGIEVPEQFQGKSFSKIMAKPGTEFRKFVFAEHNWHDFEAHERMVRDKNYMYILNSRPFFPQLGPADAVGSPSYEELVEIMKMSQISEIQADIFINPRPEEEFYDLATDPFQFNNLATQAEYAQEKERLKNILQLWMDETGDNIPENLTKDWYLMQPGYIKTDAHGIRGEMPGQKTNATKNNNKGSF